MILQRVGAAWEYAKVGGLVLWPLRFIIAVYVVMLGIFFLAQAQDALVGEVVLRQGPNHDVLVLATVTLWAVQSWYWARLLLDLPPTGLTLNHYTSEAKRVRVYKFLRIVVPRSLACMVFVTVGIFIRIAACYPSNLRAKGWGWLLVYVAAAVVFYLLTMARRAYLNRRAGGWLAQGGVWRRGHRIERVVPAALAVPPPADQVPPLSARMRHDLRISSRFALLWTILLVLTMLTALVGLGAGERRFGANLLVAVLAVAALWTIWALDYHRSRKAFMSLLIVVNAAVFLWSIDAPAFWGMLWGPAAILMLSAAVWVGATCFFLALPGHRLGLPVGSLLIAGMVFWGALPSWLSAGRGDHDNHAVRAAEGEVPGDRQTLAEAFAQWKKCTPAAGESSCTKNKMIIVAVEGGASRAAYWSAMLLGALEDSVPDFHQSVFAVSAVSGGSLGAAVYQRLLAAGASGKPRCGDQPSYTLCAASILGADFLGADFLSMFNGDLLQRLLPGNLLPDRAYALETAWERAWTATMKSDDFGAPLKLRRESEAQDAAQWLPVLLLNGTSVKTGHRIVTSDVTLDQKCTHPSMTDQTKTGSWAFADLPGAVDFFCLTRQPVRLSTAVHNSARFPYISPAGTLWAEDGEGNSWKADRIVDGGYFEVLGGVTVSDLLTLLAKDDGLKGIEVTVLAFENDPNDNPADCKPEDTSVKCRAQRLARQVGPEADTMSFALRNANDVWAPIIGLATSRTGRGDYAGDMLEAQVAALNGRTKPGDKPTDTGFIRFNLMDAAEPGRADPAMSWYLSQRSIDEMKNDACTSATVKQSLDRLGALLPAPSATLAKDVHNYLGCNKLTGQP